MKYCFSLYIIKERKLNLNRHIKNKNIKNESFQDHFVEGVYQGESDCDQEVRLKDQTESAGDVRRREYYW